MHPKIIKCAKFDGSCRLDVYTYKREICWDLLLKQSHWNRYYRRCKIPKSITSSKTLPELYNISDVDSKYDNGVYKIYLKDANANEILVTEYSKKEDADFLVKRLKADIDMWQNPSEKSEMFLRDNYIYEFEFE